MQTLNQITKELSLTLPELEIPYLLTPEEEAQAISRKIDSLKDHYSWKARNQYKSTSEITNHLKRHDFMSDFDVKEHLKKINELKYWEIDEKSRAEEKRAKEKRDIDSMMTKCDYKYMYRLLQYNSRQLGKDLIVNHFNQKYIKAVCFFLSTDFRFEQELGMSLKKGLLIRGHYGVGKTHVLRCLLDNEIRPIQMKSMIDITKHVERDGECYVNVYKKRLLFLDDVGTEEPTVNHYGTKINWFKDFIETSYMDERIYHRLIITTNCSFDEIEQKYGGRVRSRMAEMFNIIDVTGDDLRKK